MNRRSQLLVVEDSPTQALQIQAMLQQAGFTVEHVANGREAMEYIAQQRPDLVVTDLEMPEMNGLELVESVRQSHPGLPIILITARGNEVTAVEALRAGAASYVPKRIIESQLVRTARSILALSREEKSQQELLECRMECQEHFVLGHSTSMIPMLIGHLQGVMAAMHLGDETMLIRTRMALTAAIENALFHGNMETGPADEGASRSQIVVQRRDQEPYKDRRISVHSSISRSQARFVVRDDGPGFDTSALPDPSNPDHLESKGRGIMLMKSFMDEVTYNEEGNEVTLVKHQD